MLGQIVPVYPCVYSATVKRCVDVELDACAQSKETAAPSHYSTRCGADVASAVVKRNGSPRLPVLSSYHPGGVKHAYTRSSR